MAAAELRHALGHFTTGVTVVSTTDATGAPVGTTASAVSALSLDPPLVLVCLARESQTLAALHDDSRFAVNVLSAGQQALSDNFARSGTAANWSQVAHRGDPPQLDGALAVITCRVEQRVWGGDHEIVVGWVDALEVGDAELRPLLHFRGAYAGIA